MENDRQFEYIIFVPFITQNLKKPIIVKQKVERNNEVLWENILDVG
jgi:hypothetical protein